MVVESKEPAQRELFVPSVYESAPNVEGEAPQGIVVKGILGDVYGETELVASLGSDITVCNAARVSYGKRVSNLNSDDERLIQYLAKNGHTSPFRHVQFQFRVKAPEFVARQWLKHMVGCSFTDTPWNEISQRYVEVPSEFYTPSVFRVQKGKQTSGETLSETQSDAASAWYQHSVDEAKYAYKALLGKGVAREQARMVLPLSIYTEWYWTASLQAAVHFVKLRDDEHAQGEIRAYAKVIADLAESVAPVSVKALLGR